MGQPEISVVMTCYQHARFVEAAIGSVLSQQGVKFELIVVDDGSTDGSPEIVAGIDDSRLRLIVRSNGGPGAALNSGISEAKGAVVAILSADDLCLPDRLHSQYARMRRDGLDGVFGSAQLIDERSMPLPRRQSPFLRPPQDSSIALFRMLFWESNFLCASAAMFRREVLPFSPFNEALFQQQDFDLWLRLCSVASLAYVDEDVAAYRLRDGEGNLSGQHNLPRALFELASVYEAVLEDLPRSFLALAFADELDVWSEGEWSRDAAVLLLLRHRMPEVRAVALRRLLRAFPAGGALEFLGATLSGRDVARIVAAA